MNSKNKIIRDLYREVEKSKLAGCDQVPAELIQAGGEVLLSAIHKPINSIWNREELPD
jgi:hypothetical protein